MDEAGISETSDWYQKRAAACEEESRKQIFNICAIAIFGLFAIIGLNNLISAFEDAFFDRRPPNAALDQANDAIGRIEDLSASARQNAAETAERLERREAEFAAREKALQDYSNRVFNNDDLDLNESMWRRGMMAAGDDDHIYLNRAKARGTDLFVSFGSDADDIGNRLDLSHNLVGMHSFDGDLWHRSSFEFETFGLAVTDLHIAESGRIFAGGRRRNEAGVRPLLLHSLTGRAWTEVELGLPQGFGAVGQIDTLSDGNLVLSIEKGGNSTLVKETDGSFSEFLSAVPTDDISEDEILSLHVDEDDVVRVFRRRAGPDFVQDFSIEAFATDGKRTVEYQLSSFEDTGYSGAFVKDKDALMFVGGFSAMDIDEPFVLLRKEDGTWDEIGVDGLPLTGCGKMGFTGQHARLGPTWLVAAEFCRTNNAILLTRDWQNWRRLGIPGDETSIFSHVEALESNEEGQTLLLNQGIPYRLLSADEAYEVLEAAFAPEAPVAMSNHQSTGISREILANVANHKASIRLLEDEIDALKLTGAVYDDQAEKQSQVAELMRGIGVELRDALVEVDPVRQAVSFGSRLAFIGLLVFLIQIFVNRYRYLQRLSVFYSSRAKALDLFLQLQRNAGTENRISLDAVFSVLSAEGIGFGPAPSAPFLSASFGAQDVKKDLF